MPVVVVNPDGTADDTAVIRKPIAAWKLELENIKNEIDSINVHIDRLQARKAVLQARKVELRDIQSLP